MSGSTNIAGYISSFRLITGIVSGVLVLTGVAWLQVAGFCLLIIAALTDSIDGEVARLMRTEGRGTWFARNGKLANEYATMPISIWVPIAIFVRLVWDLVNQWSSDDWLSDNLIATVLWTALGVFFGLATLHYNKAKQVLRKLRAERAEVRQGYLTGFIVVSSAGFIYWMTGPRDFGDWAWFVFWTVFFVGAASAAAWFGTANRLTARVAERPYYKGTRNSIR